MQKQKISERGFAKQVLYKYAAEKPFFYTFVRPLEAEIFRRYVPFNQPVLDFGCGDGFFAKVAFIGQDTISVGIDVDFRVKAKAETSGIYGKVVIFDGRKLPFPDHSFSTIISNCVLEHVGDLPFVLQEINRVLKPGGIFLASVVTDKWEKNLVGGIVLGDLYRHWFRKIQRHVNMFSESQWKSAFTKAGFTIKKSVPYLNTTQAHWCELTHYPSVIPLWGKCILATNFASRQLALKINQAQVFNFYALTPHV